MELSTTSPRPAASHPSAQAMASIPVASRPPWVYTSNREASAHVDADHHALGAEGVGQLVDQIRLGHRRAVDTDLVGPDPQQRPGVVEGADPAAHGERDEDLLRGAGHHVDHGVPPCAEAVMS